MAISPECLATFQTIQRKTVYTAWQNPPIPYIVMPPPFPKPLTKSMKEEKRQYKKRGLFEFNGKMVEGGEGGGKGREGEGGNSITHSEQYCRLFPNSGAFFPKFRKRNAKKVRHFCEVFFRPRGRFVAFPSQSRLVVGHIRKNGQKFSDLNFRKI